MIIWITRALALAIHDRQLSEHGGGSGVRDEALLDSALARPHQRYAYGDPPPDLADLAACDAFVAAVTGTEGRARLAGFGFGAPR